MKVCRLLVSVFLGAFLSAFARAEEVTVPGQLSSQDMKFAEDAMGGGITEAHLGQLATENSTNPKVRQFGEQMVRAYQKANDELTHILDQKGMTMPMSATTGTEIEDLQNLKGEDFDRAYMKHMVKDYKSDVAEFKTEVIDGDDPELKTWAAQTLPVLQEHLKMAQSVEDSVSR